MATLFIVKAIYYFICFLFYFPEVAATKPARKRFGNKVCNEFCLAFILNKEEILEISVFE